MTNLFTKTARITAVALLASAPVAAFAVESGSPQQSVEADPDEYVASEDAVTGESMENTPIAGQEDAYDDADVVEDVDGSIYEDDAKRDG
ncbi:hypothetical protein ABMC89_05905 [Sulfitobacter sp. HNIBRBA3233]|uniref:hypothetical protein n=1 Tax=Sulfitobacter marinivivus TaxID=3158558 RepID=UPI0032DE47A9